MFEQFCSRTPHLFRCIEFLNSVEDYEIHVVETRRQTEAQRIYDEFIAPDVSYECVHVWCMYM